MAKARDILGGVVGLASRPQGGGKDGECAAWALEYVSRGEAGGGPRGGLTGIVYATDAKVAAPIWGRVRVCVSRNSHPPIRLSGPGLDKKTASPGAKKRSLDFSWS